MAGKGRRQAVVTGAGDFVGLHLVEELLQQDWRVVAFADSTSRVNQLQRLAAQYPALEIIEGDAASLKVLRDGMPDETDAIFNAVHHVSLWSREAEQQTRAHVQTTRQLVQVALEKKARRFIHTSSAAAYGLHRGTLTEDTPSKASSSNINFVRSKAAAEREVRKGLRKGLPAVIINPANMIGPYDFYGWARLFRLVDKGRLPAMAAGGGSFCHVREVARAEIRAVDAGRIGANYLLGGADTTYLNLLRSIASLLHRRTLPRPLPVPFLRGVARVDETLSAILRRRPTVTRETVELLGAQLYCKSTRAQQELGYQPVPLDVMLKDCHRWLQAEGLVRKARD